MKVADDGIGFVLEESLKEAHYGIRNMQRRAKELGGVLNLHSEKGKGDISLFENSHWVIPKSEKSPNWGIDRLIINGNIWTQINADEHRFLAFSDFFTTKAQRHEVFCVF